MDILVSICCITYNHEKYIRDCLEGFLKQKTNFAFEVLIHDDASTDHTADIIREYEEKYPDIIKPVYQTENQYSKHIRIIQTFLVPKIKGKYVAFCEGDDFWIDPYKLQKQVDALERNPQCHMCVHRVYSVSEDGRYPTKHTMPHKGGKEKVLTEKKFLDNCIGYSYQTSSYFVSAKYYKRFMEENPKFRQIADVGDVPTLFYFGQLGSVYYINDIMSCYRTQVPGSWSSRHQGFGAWAGSLENLSAWIKEYNRYTQYRFEKICEKKMEYKRINVIFLDPSLDTKQKCRTIVRQHRRGLKYISLKWRLKIYLGAIFPSLIEKYDARKARRRDQ